MPRATEGNATHSFLAPAFRERLHRGFDRSLVAARWGAAFVEAIGQSPRPIRRRHIGEHNSSYDATFADHVIDLIKSYSRPLEQKVGHFPQILFGLSSHGRALREKYSSEPLLSIDALFAPASLSQGVIAMSRDAFA